MARQITLNDQEWIEIVNAEKQVTGGFWWNPSDLDIVKRCENVMEFFGKMEVRKESGTDALFEVSEAIKGQFDYLLGADASETLFRHANPLSPRDDGSLYAEYVLDVLVKFIESELNVRMKKTNARIKKYTDKYGR